MKRLVFLWFSLLVASQCFAQQPVPTAVQDLQNWRTQGLPAAANWNVVGFSPKWHVKQVQDGHRLLPSFFTPLNGKITQWNSSSNVQTVKAYLSAFAPELQWLSDNQVPLCLRTNNIADTFLNAQYQTWPFEVSLHTWGQSIDPTANGALVNTHKIDTLSPDHGEAWATEGTALGTSLYMQTLQTLYPSPPWFQYLENNEGSYDDYVFYTPQSNTNVWDTLANVQTKSTRMAQWIVANPNIKPNVFAETFYTTRKLRYDQYFSAFENSLSAGWAGRMSTAAYSASMVSTGMLSAKAPSTLTYGYTPEALCYDAGSKQVYITQVATQCDFTSLHVADVMVQVPAWKWLEKFNAKHHREFSVYITNGGALGGLKAGKHDLVTPEMYEAYLQWMLWATHDVGVPTILRHWTSSTTQPNAPFWTAADLAYLQSAGYSVDVQSYTQEDYVMPLMTACDKICNSPTLRAFWTDSVPVVWFIKTPTDTYLMKVGKGQAYPQNGEVKDYFRMLPCGMNTPATLWTWNPKTNFVDGTIKVWATARKNKAGEILLYAWTPCISTIGTAPITITLPGYGDVVVDPALMMPGAYWIVTKTPAGLVATPVPLQ